MDVYADNLGRGLRVVRPDWQIIELYPNLDRIDRNQSAWLVGVQKYYERYWHYPKSLNHQDVDLFHIIDHTHGYLSRWLKRDRRPNVVTCHDLINLIRPDTYQGRARFPLISMTAWRLAVEGMRDANHILTVSAHTKQDTIEHLKIHPDRITVTPNAVDSIYQPVAPEKAQAFRQQQGISPETFCLLNVGSNNARKNIPAILEVVRLLKEAGLPIHFWKVSADFDAEQRRFIQAHQLESCVTYLGKLDEESLVTIYSAADVLMAPSLYEGFGLTVLEAMACGTAVVTATVSALPEVAGDAAILVDPLDTGAIAAAVQQIYEKPAYRQDLVCRGLERAKQFTWEGTAEQVARVYEAVVFGTVQK
jgi:glycosyltransferase involved in cell wall biosynthesis